MEAVVMKQLSIVLIVWWSSVMSGNAVGHVLPNNTDVQLKSDSNIVELYKGSGNGSSWLQMVLVFARHSSNSQPQLHIDDAPRNSSDKVTTKSPEVTTKSTEAPIVCKEGFIQLESKKCYLFSTESKAWHDALRSCQAMGTTLAYPLNEQESTALADYLNKNFEGIEDRWLGASDADNEGQWVWAHSQSPISYARWGVGQPDNYNNNEDCLHINKHNGWKWNDSRCGYVCHYICQQ